MKKCTIIILMALAAVACERRELWLYQDNFKQVVIDIDWRDYDRDRQLYPHTPDPGGMTLWFYPADGRPAYTYTTREVNRFETYLSAGDYKALVIDYSPQEYGRQNFIGMDYAETAKVEAARSPYQPDADMEELYGQPCYAKKLPLTEPTGLYTAVCQPELMASDTLAMHIISGSYDNYIPYKERDTYQDNLVMQYFHMNPLLVPWHMRVRIPVRGIYYLREATATLAGMADGYMLVKDQYSEVPCLFEVSDWEVHVTGDNEGYIAATFLTWGLRWSMWADKPRYRQPPYAIDDTAPDELRLNLRCLLRDRKTVVYFHLDVGNQVWVFGNEWALSIDLRDVLKGDDIPTLPYVEGVNGLDLGGVVIPWEDGAKVDVGM